MKRAPDEKECRPLPVSRPRHNSASRRSSSRRSSGSKVARLSQQIVARARGRPKPDREDNNRRKRRHQFRVNFGAITPAAPGREVLEPFFL
jgi:hypothetical protein